MHTLTKIPGRDLLVCGMNVTRFKTKGYGSDSLPVLHRTTRVPGSLWAAAKGRAASEGKPLRHLIDQALDAELTQLVETLRQSGLRGELTPDKLVRIPLDDNVIGRLNLARRRTGLPAVVLLRACLAKHLKPECDS